MEIKLKPLKKTLTLIVSNIIIPVIKKNNPDRNKIIIVLSDSGYFFQLLFIFIAFHP